MPSAQCARDPRLLTMAEYVCTNMGLVVWGVRRGGDTASRPTARRELEPGALTAGGDHRLGAGGKSAGSSEGMGCLAGDARGCVHGGEPDGS